MLLASVSTDPSTNSKVPLKSCQGDRGELLFIIDFNEVHRLMFNFKIHFTYSSLRLPQYLY
uniref:Uncharacterized protein n=1 Tax=Romanomermis culicivorax TaxID=13658 RepID=A0A915KI30_ROMCU